MYRSRCCAIVPLTMSPATKVWLQRATVVLIVVLVSALIVPRFAVASLGLGVFSLASVGLVAMVLGLPFLAWLVFGAFYKVFLKPNVRAWHINRIRNNRYLREAVDRGDRGN